MRQLLACVCGLIGSALFADQFFNLVKPMPSVTLKDGRTLTNVQVVGFGTNVLTAKWDGGRGTIAYEDLPKGVADALEPYRQAKSSVTPVTPKATAPAVKPADTEDPTAAKPTVAAPDLSSVTLVNGSTIRLLSIVRWEKDGIVAKYPGGVAPFKFAGMSNESRAVFESQRDAALAAQEAVAAEQHERAAQAQAAYNAKFAWKDRVQKAINDHSLLVGMTADEARLSWGRPDRINASGGISGGTEQWIYGRNTNSPVYVYFRDNILTSWQDSR